MQNSSNANFVVNDLVIDDMPKDWQRSDARAEIFPDTPHLREIGKAFQCTRERTKVLIRLCFSPAIKSTHI